VKFEAVSSLLTNNLL